MARLIISPFRVVFCFVILSLFSGIVISRLKVDILPHERIYRFAVTFSLPNSSPSVIEEQVTSVLEGAFSRIDNIKHITSTSTYNQGRITIEFSEGVNLQVKHFEVGSIIKQVYPGLPSLVSFPIITDISSNTDEERSPILIYSINAPFLHSLIKNESEHILRRALSGITGIDEIRFSGADDPQITIEFEKDKCNLFGVKPEMIVSKLKSLYSVSFPGKINSKDGQQFFIRLEDNHPAFANIENIPIQSFSGSQLKIKDVARVFKEEQDKGTYYRINGKNSISLSVFASEGQNNIILGDTLRNQIKKASVQFPQGYEIRLEYDNTKFVKKEIEKSYHKLEMSAFILVLMVLLFYRSWKYLLLLSSGLFVTINFTIILAWLFQINIHLYSIAGFAIAFGLMMDSSIVMLDSFHRSKSSNAIKGMVTGNIITVFSLLLVIFLPQEEKSNLIDFSMIIILSLLSSMVIVLVFLPNMHKLIFPSNNFIHPSSFNYRMVKRRVAHLRYYFGFLQWLSFYRKTFITAVILLIGVPTFLLPSKFNGEQLGAKLYNRSFGNEYFAENIRPVLDKLCGGTISMFLKNISDRSGYRSPEETRLYIIADLPYGNTPEQMNFVLSRIEQRLSDVKEVDKYIAHVFSGQHGVIAISFKEEVANTMFPYQLKNDLVTRSMEWGGVEWNVHGIGQGFNNVTTDEPPGFQILMKGYNYDQLHMQAEAIATELSKNIRVKKININEKINNAEKSSQEYVVDILSDKIAILKTNRNEILGKLVFLSKPLQPMTEIMIANNNYPVFLKEEKGDLFSDYQLVNQTISLDSTRMIRLNSFVGLKKEPTLSSIEKADRQYIRLISFEYSGNAQFGNKYLQKVLETMKKALPMGFTAEQNNMGSNDNSVFKNYLLLGVLLLFIYFSCTVLFENLKQPIYVILMIPVSYIGLFVVFAKNDFYFDQGGYASFIMLGALVSCASILLINEYNYLRKMRKNISSNRVLIKAVAGRSGTIALTTLSSCCGLIPFLAGGQNEVFWFSLALGIISGLLFSLLALFIVLPLFLWEKL